MIPAFTCNGLLPPFVGDLTVSTGHSPYLSTMEGVVDRFATSRQRCSILEGFLNFRSALHGAGMINGIQWLDGSFVEARTPDHPGDIDVITFYALARPEEAAFLANNKPLVRSSETKRQFKVDAFFVSLLQNPAITVSQTTFWYGLFGHQKGTGVWKGMVQVPLPATPDADVGARALLATRAT